MVIYRVGYYIICGFGFSVLVYGSLHQIVDRVLQLLCVTPQIPGVFFFFFMASVQVCCDREISVVT